MVTLTGVSRYEDIPLQHVEVELAAKQNMTVKRPEDPRSKQLKIVLIRRNIRVWGALDDTHRARLKWAAENCPVGKSIEGSIRIIDDLEVVEDFPPRHTDSGQDRWRDEVQGLA